MRTNFCSVRLFFVRCSWILFRAYKFLSPGTKFCSDGSKFCSAVQILAAGDENLLQRFPFPFHGTKFCSRKRDFVPLEQNRLHPIKPAFSLSGRQICRPLRGLEHWAILPPAESRNGVDLRGYSPVSGYMSPGRGGIVLAPSRKGGERRPGLRAPLGAASHCYARDAMPPPTGLDRGGT